MLIFRETPILLGGQIAFRKFENEFGIFWILKVTDVHFVLQNITSFLPSLDAEIYIHMKVWLLLLSVCSCFQKHLC